MRIFRMDGYDWVCANNPEEAVEYYVRETGCDNDGIEAIECDAKEKMWYGFNDFNKLQDFLLKNRTVSYPIKSGERYSLLDLHISLSDCIELDNITEPCIIASTDF